MNRNFTFLIVILGKVINVCRGNIVAILSHNDCFERSSLPQNTTQLIIAGKKHCLTFLNMTVAGSLGENIKIFNDVVNKREAVAFLFPRQKFIEQFWQQFKFDAPALFMECSQEMEEMKPPMKICMTPPLNDSVGTIVETLHEHSSLNVAVIYNDHEGNVNAAHSLEFHLKYVHSIKSFKLGYQASITEMSVILANIIFSQTRTIVVYANEAEFNELLSVANMMKMTGFDYTWLLSWKINVENNELPKNTLTIRPQYMNNDDLMLDAQELVIRSFQHYFNHCHKLGSSTERCFEKYNAESGHLLRQMSKSGFTGRTGNVNFNEQGLRVNIDYEIVSLNNNTGMTSWARDPAAKITNRQLRVVTALTDPFVSINQFKTADEICGTGMTCKLYSGNNITHHCCDGMIIELLRTLQIDLKIDVVLHVSKDLKYGAYDPKTKQWNGMIGELIRGEADMSIADLTITESRSKVVDFTHPFMEIGSGVLVNIVQKTFRKGVWGVFKPVALELWLTSILVVFAMTLVFWFIERIHIRISNLVADSTGEKQSQRRPLDKFSLAESLFYTWATLVRTTDGFKRPSSTSAKIGAIGFAICSMVFVTSFTAQLAAFLMEEEQITVITDGIHDKKLRIPGRLKIATVSGCSTEEFFRDSTEPLFMDIWKEMKNNSVITVANGIEKLKAGEIDVFLNDYPTLIYHAAKDKDCAMRVVGHQFFQSGFGIAFPKKSPWTAIVTRLLLDYERNDHVLQLIHRWLRSSCKNVGDDNDNVTPLTFRRMSTYDKSGTFALIAIAVTLSVLVVFFVNMYFQARKSKCRDIVNNNENKKETENCEEQSKL